MTTHVKLILGLQPIGSVVVFRPNLIMIGHYLVGPLFQIWIIPDGPRPNERYERPLSYGFLLATMHVTVVVNLLVRTPK